MLRKSKHSCLLSGARLLGDLHGSVGNSSGIDAVGIRTALRAPLDCTVGRGAGGSLGEELL